MFKNAFIYKFNPDWNPDLALVEAGLETHRFIECGASQEKSAGWIEPRGAKHGPLVEAVDGQWIMKIQSESKIMPASVVNAKVDKRIEQIENATGRKPGKKETREIREDTRHELLPMAFTKVSSSLVWIDRKARLLVIEATTQSQVDEVVTMLVKSLDGLAVSMLQTKLSPTFCMSNWLNSQELPPDFTADRDCVLKASDESKASIRYARHPLDTDEVRAHIAGGKLPTMLAMTWDSRLSFVLAESGAIKKIEYLEAAIEAQNAKNAADNFEADVAIATGTLSRMFPALIDAFGGEVLVDA